MDNDDKNIKNLLDESFAKVETPSQEWVNLENKLILHPQSMGLKFNLKVFVPIAASIILTILFGSVKYQSYLETEEQKLAYYLYNTSEYFEANEEDDFYLEY